MVQARLRHKNVARAWKKVECISYRANGCIFLLANSVEALIEEERSQRAQVETGLYTENITFFYQNQAFFLFAGHRDLTSSN